VLEFVPPRDGKVNEDRGVSALAASPTDILYTVILAGASVQRRSPKSLDRATQSTAAGEMMISSVFFLFLACFANPVPQPSPNRIARRINIGADCSALLDATETGPYCHAKPGEERRLSAPTPVAR
jgi:hypothetical protein